MPFGWEKQPPTPHNNNSRNTEVLPPDKTYSIAAVEGLAFNAGGMTAPV